MDPKQFHGTVQTHSIIVLIFILELKFCGSWINGDKWVQNKNQTFLTN